MFYHVFSSHYSGSSFGQQTIQETIPAPIRNIDQSTSQDHLSGKHFNLVLYILLRRNYQTHRHLKLEICKQLRDIYNYALLMLFYDKMYIQQGLVANGLFKFSHNYNTIYNTYNNCF